jgi:hypothetical protein
VFFHARSGLNGSCGFWFLVSGKCLPKSFLQSLICKRGYPENAIHFQLNSPLPETLNQKPSCTTGSKQILENPTLMVG